MNQELLYYKNLAKERGDPQLYLKTKDKLFVSFLDNLKTFDFSDQIPKQSGHRYHMVMGLISAGKSSLLKKVTGINLKTGKGDTTQKASRIGAFKCEN